jgi:antirestriction protein ArdC
VRMPKSFTVFNVAQCEGLPDRIVNPAAPQSRNRDARDPLLDEFIATAGATIKEGGDRATYFPEPDNIVVPAFAAFVNAAEFYNTILHELVHWTGHAARLNRMAALKRQFEDHDRRYAVEELIAELGSAFICAEFAIDSIAPSARYLDTWVKLLSGDDRAFFTACSQAQKAVDYLRDLALAEPKAA